MVRITVKPYYPICDAIGKIREIKVELDEESTVLDLLIYLRESYNLQNEVAVGKSSLKLFDGKELMNLLVLMNGMNILQLQGLQTKLKDNAVIALFTNLVGG